MKILSKIGGFSIGQEADFESAGEMASVLGVLSSRFFGVETLETPKNFIHGQEIEFGADGFVSRWCLGWAMGEEFEIESGATDNKGDFATSLDIGNDGAGEGFVSGGIKSLGKVELAVEVVWDEGFFVFLGCGGEGFEALIELKSVRVDDFTIPLLGERESIRALSGRRWSAEIEGFVDHELKIGPSG